MEVRSRENCASASKNGVTAKTAVPPFFEVVLQFFVFTPYFLAPLPPLPLPPLPPLPPLESLGERLAPGISLGGADFEGASAADFFCLAAFFCQGLLLDLEHLYLEISLPNSVGSSLSSEASVPKLVVDVST